MNNFVWQNYLARVEFNRASETQRQKHKEDYQGGEDQPGGHHPQGNRPRSGLARKAESDRQTRPGRDYDSGLEEVKNVPDPFFLSNWLSILRWLR